MVKVKNTKDFKEWELRNFDQLMSQFLADNDEVYDAYIRWAKDIYDNEKDGWL